VHAVGVDALRGTLQPRYSQQLTHVLEVADSIVLKSKLIYNWIGAHKVWTRANPAATILRIAMRSLHPPRRIRPMRTHIKIVAIVNLLFSAMGILAAAGALFSGVFGSLFSGSLTVAVVGSIASVAAALVIGALSLFGLIAGFGLLNHQQWARYVIIVVSALRLFRFPMGTLFGGYSLWVLTHRETRMIFDSRMM